MSRPRKSELLSFLHNLPALSDDQDFQLWVIEKDKAPHPSTVFQSLGQVTELQVKFPAGVVALQAFALTIEPKGGSPQPTGLDGRSRKVIVSFQ